MPAKINTNDVLGLVKIIIIEYLYPVETQDAFSALTNDNENTG